MPVNESKNSSTITENKKTVDVVVVGAGLAGLFMLHKLRALGLSV